MNISTLQKCVEELKKDAPNISYVLGMLETVIEMNGASIPSYPSMPYPYPSSPMPLITPHVISTTTTGVRAQTEEEIMAEKYSGGTIGTIQ